MTRQVVSSGTPSRTGAGDAERSSRQSLLRNRRYLVYNAEHAFTSFGYSIYAITIPAFSFVFSGSILFTGLTLFVEYGIYTLTFLTGPVVDRVADKRRVLITSEAAVAGLALVLGVLIESGSVGDPTFLAIVGGIAVAWDFAWTADWTVLPLIVTGEELPRARGYASAVSNGHTVAGLGVGGMLFLLLGAYSSILLYSVCMLTAAFLIFFLPAVVPREGRVHAEGFLAGWKYVFGQKTLLYLSLTVGVFAFFTQMPVLGITKIFAQTSALWYSVMFTLYYAGSTVSGAVLGRFYPSRRIWEVLISSYALAGILLVVSVALAGSPAVDAILWLTLGFVFTGWITLYSVYLQATTAREMLGRAASNLYTFRGLTSAAGTISLPFLIKASGVVGASNLSGICMILLAVIMYGGLPALRRTALKVAPSGVTTSLLPDEPVPAEAQ